MSDTPRIDTRLDFDSGKYTVIIPHQITMDNRFRALRHGEEWRDLTGDGLVLYMAYRVAELQQHMKQLQDVTREMRCQLHESGYSRYFGACETYDSLPHEVKGETK